LPKMQLESRIRQKEIKKAEATAEEIANAIEQEKAEKANLEITTAKLEREQKNS